MNKYSEIPPILEIETRRNMTVNELIEALQEYPGDGIIHISIDREPRQFLEIKSVSPIVEMGNNQPHPVLNIGIVKIKE